MGAIYRREMGSYFTSAIAYVVLAVFNIFAGVFFFGNCLIGDSANLTPVFTSMFLIMLFVVPILTMKLLSEEKRQKTDQALLTAPVSLIKIVLGKFFSACTVLACCFAVFIVYGLVISCFTQAAWSSILCNFVGMYLTGCALVAIGLFVSSLTESQVVAAIASFAAGLFIYMMDSIASVIPISFISDFITSLSFVNHLQKFSTGLFNLSDVVFFLSAITIFIFLTIKVIEKKRWS